MVPCTQPSASSIIPICQSCSVLTASISLIYLQSQSLWSVICKYLSMHLTDKHLVPFNITSMPLSHVCSSIDNNSLTSEIDSWPPGV